jgi:hypothetical protein
MSFTRIKDLDLEILSKMDDRELGRICSTDKYFAKLCQNNMFWKNRTVKRFGKYFGNNLDKYFLDSEKTTWRDYYISIIDFLEKIYSKKIFHYDGKRDDLKLLSNIIMQNDKILRKELETHYELQRWKEMLKLELINPNNAFGYYNIVDGDLELIRYLLKMNDVRIKPSIAIKEYLAEYEENEDRIEELKKLVKIVLADKRVTVDDVIQSIENILEDTDVRMQDYTILDLYLDYIIKQGAVEHFRDRIWVNNPDQQPLISHIYERISPYIQPALPKIFELLRNKKFSVLSYDKIMDFIEDESK